MIDDSEEVAGAAPFPRAYDFFKHMTGITLISMGGVFAFLDGDGAQLEKRQIISVLVFIGLSGVTSLMMVTTLAAVEVKATSLEKLAKTVRVGQLAASFFLAVGLGNFVPAFAEALFK